MDKLVFDIEKIVRDAGNIILTAEREKLNIESKEGIGNFVTYYDKKVQTFLKEKLLELQPEANFIAEEEELYDSILKEGYTFIVDPIDGTTNFVRNIFMSIISVGMLKDGERFIGVCYNPYMNEMYLAQKEKGAFLNGERIHVSNKTLKDGIVLTGSAPYYGELREKSLRVLTNFVSVANDFRRLGTAAYELCLVAAGKMELQFELRLQPWDVAASSLIVEEAGGKVTNINGETISLNGPTSILATNNQEDYFKYIKDLI